MFDNISEMKNIKFLKFFSAINYFFIFLSLFLLLYTFYRAEVIFESSQFKYYFKYYLIFFISLIFWIYVSRTSIESKTVFSITGLLILIVLYTFETIKFYNFSLSSFSSSKNIEILPKSEKLKLIEKLEKTNKNVHPSIIPNIFLSEKKLTTFPLSGVSNSKTVFCKEGPEFSIYQSDRYGFNNPDNSWDKSIDYMIIGDSFAQGACVNEGEDIASQLRSLTGKKIITLGMAGNGPLIEFASLKEYVSDIDVKSIFWIYYERNDLDDLIKEKKNPILIKYLDDNFSQELKTKQLQVNTIVKKKILDEKNFLRYNNLLPKKNYDSAFQQIIRLQIIRDKLALDRGIYFKIDPLFEQIIIKAKNFSKNKKANFYFVYLPDKESFMKHNLSKKNLYKKNEVMKILKDNNIDLIDIYSLLFLKEKDPFDLFAQRIYGHYSADTYSKIAQIIKSYID